MRQLSIHITTLRSFLNRNKMFFIVIFGIITAFGIIYNIYHPHIKEDTANKTETENTQKADTQFQHISPPSTDKTVNELEVGEDSVVIGNVKGKVGSGSVVIGATDNKGNVILNQSMAVGRNAKAGKNSIAIGANAGAGLKESQPENSELK